MLSCVLALIAAWHPPTAAHAAVGGITEYAVPTGDTPTAVAAGPDGNVWFAAGSRGIARVSPTGANFMEFLNPLNVTGSGSQGIAAGPDGNVWFTFPDIYRMTPTFQSLTDFAPPTANSSPRAITAGPDGNLWFTESAVGKVGKITTTGTISEFTVPSGGCWWIASGPDGNLWFTEPSPNKIGRITTAGVITEFAVPTAASGPRGITGGPDGNVWFTEASAGKIARITPAGVVTEFAGPYAGSYLASITLGPDGNLWFSEGALAGGTGIGRITPAGVVAEYSTMATPFATQMGIAAGPSDGNVWFSEPGANRIARVVATALVPEAPTDVLAAPGNTTASVTWTAPSDNGSSITGYTVVSSPGGLSATAAGNATGAIVTGLTNGTAYTFTVAATNANGNGPGALSAFVMVAGTPGAPTGVTATAGNASATVTWTAPASNGSAITGYAVGSTPGGITALAAGNATSATVTGLTNGTAYTFRVNAINSYGGGPASAPSNSVTPIGPPSAPTGVTATWGNATATISWGTPAFDGGSPITGYTVTSSPGAIAAAAAGNSTSATVSGLTNGTTYTFTVTATNAVGTGPPSAPSNSVTPGVPAAPTNPGAVPGNASAMVSWSAPADNGSPISGYTVTSIPDLITASAAGNSISATVSGLTNGHSYTFVVTATNAVGTGPASTQSNSVVVGAPTAPSGVVAVAGNATATVSWTAPSSDNGSAITGYTVIAGPISGPFTLTAAPGNATSAVVSGLTNGTTYTFSVTATNANGTSLPSAPSNSVTPLGPPGAPTGVSATAGNASATVRWSAPAANGGSAITSYTVLSSPGLVTASAGPLASSATVTGLANGTSYTFTVTATNAVGTGPASAPSNSVIPVGLPPGVPTNVTATNSGYFGGASAVVRWTVGDSGGYDYLTFSVVSSPGSIQTWSACVGCAGGSSSVVVTGLTNGTAYAFTVTASNGAGSSAPSAPSNSFTPAWLPGAPAISSATAGNRSAGLAWTAPADNGGSPITGYRVTPYIGMSAQASSIFGSPATTQTIAGLSNGTTYTFTVAAINAIGTGPDSAASGPVVLPPSAPGPVNGVHAVGGDGQATVSWSAAADTGGSPITGYRVTPYIEGAPLTPVTFASTATTQIVSGLLNGHAHAFSVAAQNAIGVGPESALSNTVNVRGGAQQVTAVPTLPRAPAPQVQPAGVPSPRSMSSASPRPLPAAVAAPGRPEPVVAAAASQPTVDGSAVAVTRMAGDEAPASPNAPWGVLTLVLAVFGAGALAPFRTRQPTAAEGTIRVQPDRESHRVAQGEEVPE